MPQVLWPLCQGRPAVEVVPTLALVQQPVTPTLLADTEAGSLHVPVE
jgi:hypothetical protein